MFFILWTSSIISYASSSIKIIMDSAAARVTTMHGSYF
jgi:hypothetical protein